jgi:hypothetical protein
MQHHSITQKERFNALEYESPLDEEMIAVLVSNRLRLKHQEIVR